MGHDCPTAVSSESTNEKQSRLTENDTVNSYNGFATNSVGKGVMFWGCLFATFVRLDIPCSRYHHIL